MSSLIPDLQKAGVIQANKKMIMVFGGITISLLIGGLVYGLTSDSNNEKKTEALRPYSTHKPDSPELNRIRKEVLTYAEPLPVAEAPVQPVPEFPDITPQPFTPPVQPALDPDKVAVRKSAISVLDRSSAASTDLADIITPSQSVLPAQAGALSELQPGDLPADEAISPSGVDGEPSNDLILPGTIIKARLDVAVDTTHPGLVRARVVETVFDHETGRHPLIPQGALLIGEPASDTRHGQERIFIAWTSLTLPDGRVVDMSSTSASDGAGRGGIAANVDNHYFELFASAVLSSIISVGATLPGGDPDEILTLEQRAARNVSSSVAQTGATIVNRAAGIPPTLTVAPGELVTIIVNRPIILEKI